MVDLYKKFLLPNWCKTIGGVLLIPGVILGIIRFFYGLKFSILDFKWFAIYSNYLEAKTFIMTENNFGEEIPSLLIVMGLLLIAFAKEKNESDLLIQKRLTAFILSFYINTILLIISILFVFGIGFIHVLIFNMFSFLVIFIIVFQLLISRE